MTCQKVLFPCEKAFFFSCQKVLFPCQQVFFNVIVTSSCILPCQKVVFPCQQVYFYCQSEFFLYYKIFRLLPSICCRRLVLCCALTVLFLVLLYHVSWCVMCCLVVFLPLTIFPLCLSLFIISLSPPSSCSPSSISYLYTLSCLFLLCSLLPRSSTCTLSISSLSLFYLIYQLYLG